MSRNWIVKRIIKEINDHNSFLVASHINPDGDSICSLLVFNCILKFLDKERVLFSLHPVPKRFSFLPDAKRIGDRIDRVYEEIVVLDTPILKRIGTRLPKKALINIDHHPSNSYFGRINWVESSASATCELLFYLIRSIGLKISEEIATLLYTGLYTETGGFSYPNTTKEAMRIAAALLDYGASPASISQRVSSLSVKDVHLLSKVLHNLEFSSGIATIYLSKRMQESFRASDSQSDDFIKFPLALQGVKVAIFLREEKANVIRISFRSLGEVDVNRLAKKLGGGGHRTAAGTRLYTSLKRAREEVLKVTKSFIG